MKLEAPIISFYEYVSWLNLFGLTDSSSTKNLMVRYFELNPKNKDFTLACACSSWLYRNEGIWE